MSSSSSSPSRGATVNIFRPVLTLLLRLALRRDHGLALLLLELGGGLCRSLGESLGDGRLGLGLGWLGLLLCWHRVSVVVERRRVWASEWYLYASVELD